MDSEQNKTAETAAQENANHSRMVEVPISTIIKGLDKRGISYEVIEVPATDDNGKPVLDSNGNRVMRQAVHITEIPEDEQAVMDFMAGKECWFPGCEELREAYNREYDEAGGDGGCTTCQKNKIMRKYVPKIKQAVRDANGYKNKWDTGPEQLPGPGGQGPSGASVVRPSLLRRASSRIKKILRACVE